MANEKKLWKELKECTQPLTNMNDFESKMGARNRTRELDRKSQKMSPNVPSALRRDKAMKIAKGEGKKPANELTTRSDRKSDTKEQAGIPSYLRK